MGHDANIVVRLTQYVPGSGTVRDRCRAARHP
jgi:hypothetical protein